MAGLTFDPVKHRYFLDAIPLPSITGVIAAAGLSDYSGIPEAVLRRKQQLGKAVHLAACFVDKGTLDWASVHPDTVPYIKAYESFIKKTGFSPLFAEQPLASKRLRFAGTPDRLGLLYGKHAIVEIKCSVNIEPAAAYQTAAQAILVEENKLVPKVKVRYALHLKPDASYKLVPFKDATDRFTFVAALHLFHIRSVNGQIKENDSWKL